MTAMLRLTGLCLALAAAGVAFSHAETTKAQPAAEAQAPKGCTFHTLSAEDQSRYRSRYQRRVRTDGQAFAENWLRGKVCPTQAELDERRRRTEGKNCRAVARPVTSMDGSMTVGIGRKCS